MDRVIEWPDGYDFAFTVVDDTDGATLENIRPVYDYLYEKGILTTKTCWAYPPRDAVYQGQSLQDPEYREYLQLLQTRGFEMAFHNAGSGGFKREETLAGLELFRSAFGVYPRMHINHSNNRENVYWGAERFSPMVRRLYSLRKKAVPSEGTHKESEYFWGDFCKEHIKYIRNRTFNGINTLKEDPRLVYKETGKDDCSNYWFSSSEGMRLESFVKLLTKENIDLLVSQKGCCIVYSPYLSDLFC